MSTLEPTEDIAVDALTREAEGRHIAATFQPTVMGGEKGEDRHGCTAATKGGTLMTPSRRIAWKNRAA